MLIYRCRSWRELKKAKEKTEPSNIGCDTPAEEDAATANIRKLLYENTETAVLRLVECYMEAAPQLTLQLYVVVVETPPIDGSHVLGRHHPLAAT